MGDRSSTDSYSDSSSLGRHSIHSLNDDDLSTRDSSRDSVDASSLRTPTTPSSSTLPPSSHVQTQQANSGSKSVKERIGHFWQKNKLKIGGILMGFGALNMVIGGASMAALGGGAPLLVIGAIMFAAGAIIVGKDLWDKENIKRADASPQKPSLGKAFKTGAAAGAEKTWKGIKATPGAIKQGGEWALGKTLRGLDNMCKYCAEGLDNVAVRCRLLNAPPGQILDYADMTARRAEETRYSHRDSDTYSRSSRSDRTTRSSSADVPDLTLSEAPKSIDDLHQREIKSIQRSLGIKNLKTDPIEIQSTEQFGTVRSLAFHCLLSNSSSEQKLTTRCYEALARYATSPEWKVYYQHLAFAARLPHIQALITDQQQIQNSLRWFDNYLTNYPNDIHAILAKETLLSTQAQLSGQKEPTSGLEYLQEIAADERINPQTRMVVYQYIGQLYEIKDAFREAAVIARSQNSDDLAELYENEAR